MKTLGEAGLRECGEVARPRRAGPSTDQGSVMGGGASKYDSHPDPNSRPPIGRALAPLPAPSRLGTRCLQLADRQASLSWNRQQRRLQERLAKDDEASNDEEYDVVRFSEIWGPSLKRPDLPSENWSGEVGLSLTKHTSASPFCIFLLSLRLANRGDRRRRWKTSDWWPA